MKSDFQMKELMVQRKKLLKECQKLLLLIANHRYSIKLLLNAKNYLQIIANYKRRNK